jgi:hypothetical protein
LLGYAGLLYFIQKVTSNYRGMISGEHFKLAKRYVKPTALKVVSIALDRVDYGEKHEAIVVAY